MIVYQYFFIPKDYFNEGKDLTPYQLASKRLPTEQKETEWGIYERVIAVWNIKLKEKANALKIG